MTKQMNKTEFEKQLKILKDIYDNDLVILQKQYACLNNIVKIGDIIEDYQYNIKVDKIEVITSSFDSKYPECIYIGNRITPNGIFFQDNSRYEIYQSDLKKINGVEVKNEN